MPILNFFSLCIHICALRYFICQVIQSNNSQISVDCLNQIIENYINSSVDQIENNYTLNKINDFFLKKLIVNEILNKKEVVDSKDLSRLRKALLYFYDRKSRPISNSSKPIQVKIGISVSQINKLDEVYQVISFH